MDLDLPRKYHKCQFCYHQVSHAINNVPHYYCEVLKQIFDKSHSTCLSFSSIYDHDGDEVYEHAGHLYSLHPFPTPDGQFTIVF